MSPRGQRGLRALLAGTLGLGSSALIPREAALTLAAGLVAVVLVAVLSFLLILFCDRPFRRLLELVRELRGRPSQVPE